MRVIYLPLTLLIGTKPSINSPANHFCTGLVKNARLKHFKHIYSEGFSTDFRQPCVVFCGHPSLRFGDAVHFIELWGSNPLHTVIFTGECLSKYKQTEIPFVLRRCRAGLPLSSRAGSVSTVGYESHLLSH